ncbi:Dynein light chain [Melia azedarach]|uniref:Dynein light chain n=1 Tax=Melia azedarach TaxID=155640 RepID=A0ACC1WZI3_MELAZ|nr:Dynein light chain [Melia azedarach]
MLQKMQQDALHLAAKPLDVFYVTESTHVAHFIKEDFDRAYGQGWQCTVGTDYGSFVTHCHGCSIYFGIGSLSILLFRVIVNQVAEANLFQALETVNA